MYLHRTLAANRKQNKTPSLAAVPELVVDLGCGGSG